MPLNDAVQIIPTDALSGLRTIPDATVQACVTSPPFYMLRWYGASTLWPDGWEGELGHEPHPNDFVRHLLFVFDEVWRTLKPDGCLWVNLADTYNSKQGKHGNTNHLNGTSGRYATLLRQQPHIKHFVPTLAHKSEMGVPFRFHLAMTDPEFRRFVGAPPGPQWICRRTLIWAKSLVRLHTQTTEGRAIPDPTMDRPARNYEFLFLFTKQPQYYFDRSALRVPTRSRAARQPQTDPGSVWETPLDSVADDVWRINPHAAPFPHLAMWPPALVKHMILPTTREDDIVLDPFGGSGTTAEVAYRMKRRAIIIEPSPPCVDALEDRLFRLSDRLL